MSNKLEDLVPPGPADLCFQSSAFTKESFSVDQFLQDHRSGASLETMRDDLGIYLKVLRSAMIDLINKDYADYVNLSSNLMGLDKAIGNINAPLGQLREELMQVNQYINNAVSEMTQKLEHKKALRERKRSLRCLGRVRMSLGKLQGLFDGTVCQASTDVKVVEGKLHQSSTDVKLLNGSISQLSTDMQLLERAVTEYSQLQSNIEKCNHLMTQQEKQIESEVRQRLVNKLSSVFEELFKQGEEAIERLALVLNYSFQINSQHHIQRLLREKMVGPAMEQLINKESLRSQPRGLAGLYDKILHYIDDDIKHLLYITTHYRGLERLNILESIVWPEIERRLQLNLTSIYDVGDANTFYQRYSETLKFLEEFSSRLSSPESRQTWISQDTCTSFLNNWNLPVYFQIRYQEIVRSVESELARGSETSNSSDWRLISGECVWNAVTKCWSPGLHIIAISDKMWKLTLQIISRYHVWIQQTLSQKGDDKTDLLVNIYCDVGTLVGKSKDIESLVTSSIPAISSTTSTSLHSSLEEGMEKLRKTLSSLESGVISCLSARCTVFVRQVSDIPRLYRRTNRDEPTKPCQYVMSMVEPAKMFNTNHSKTVPTVQWLNTVFSQLTNQYLKLVSEVLTSVQKTEESLRRLKKARQTGNSAPTLRTPDDDKIRLQLLIDVNTYQQQIEELGLEVGRVEGLTDLVNLVQSSQSRL